MTLQDADSCFTAGRRYRARTPLNALLTHYRGDCLAPGEQELVDALFVDGGEGIGLLTGISELSVSFRAGRQVAIRALSEILQRQSLDAALASAGLHWGMEMLNRVSSYVSSSYASPLFREIYEILYLHDLAEPTPLFRFGIATELGGASPILKMYFDLHATKVERRQTCLGLIAGLLDETSGLEAWKHACPVVDLDKSRVIGVDFGPGNAIRAKFYWGVRHLTWDDIAAALREISGERHAETLQRLRREVCGVADALSSLLVSLCAEGGKRSMKLDVCIARIYENDGQAYDAIKRFLGSSSGGVDGPPPFELVSSGLKPCQTKCIQQYLGIEFPPDGDSRVNLYYRPIGLETEHLNAALCPRMCA